VGEEGSVREEVCVVCVELHEACRGALHVELCLVDAVKKLLIELDSFTDVALFLNLQHVWPFLG